LRIERKPQPLDALVVRTPACTASLASRSSRSATSSPTSHSRRCHCTQWCETRNWTLEAAGQKACAEQAFTIISAHSAKVYACCVSADVTPGCAQAYGGWRKDPLALALCDWWRSHFDAVGSLSCESADRRPQHRLGRAWADKPGAFRGDGTRIVAGCQPSAIKHASVTHRIPGLARRGGRRRYHEQDVRVHVRHTLGISAWRPTCDFSPRAARRSKHKTTN